MGIFSKKPTFAFSEILKGLQQAINSANSMLQAQQTDDLSRYWTKEGKPVTRKIQIGQRELEVPLIALVSHNNLVMDDVEVKFKAKIGKISPHSMPNAPEANNTISHTELEMSMNGIKADADNVMEITIHFKHKETSQEVYQHVTN